MIAIEELSTFLKKNPFKQFKTRCSFIYSQHSLTMIFIPTCQHLQINTYFMIKEQQVNPLSYVGMYKIYRILLKYSSQQPGSIEIEVENTDTMERYSKVIDQIEMSERVQFNCLPSDPIFTYQYMVEHFNDIVFEDSGVLKFIYVWEMDRQKRETLMKITLKKQEIGQLDLAVLRINRLREEHHLSQQKIKRQLLQKDAKIKKLQDRLKRSIRGQKTQRQKNRKKFEEMGERVKRQLQQQFQRNSRQQQEQAQTGREMFRELSEKMRKQIQDQQSRHRLQLAGERQKNIEQIQQLRKEFQGRLGQKKEEGGLGRKMEKPAIEHHAGNAHKIYYNLVNINATSAKIIRQGEIGCYNFVNETEIPPNRRRRYQIKIVKTENCNIMIGFCTNAGLGVKNNNSSRESAYYQCSGYFCQGGEYAEHNVLSKGGDTIECEADLEVGLLRWRRNGLLLKDLGIPEMMRGKAAYLSLIMTNPGDEVEIYV